MLCLYIPICVCVSAANNKEEAVVVQKARPVSTDVGSSNPNVSDLMDEFIQERLGVKGTVVRAAPADTNTRAERSMFVRGVQPSNAVWLFFFYPAGPSWQQPGQPGGPQGPA